MTKLYKAYLFKTKDPAIDELRTLFQDKDRKISNADLQEIENNGGPSVGTMRAWFFGDTLRPNNCTLEAAGRARGYRRQWVKEKK